MQSTPSPRQLANAGALLLVLICLFNGNLPGVAIVLVVRVLVSPFFP